MAGIQLLDVPYRGGPQALTDLIGGQVNIMFATVAITHRQVKAGKLAALGVSTTKRASLLLDVPPIAQAGVPGYAMSIWWGVLAPAGTPNAIAEKLNREIAAVLSMPESKQWLENEGADVASMSRADFGRLLATEVQKWTRVARESNIKAE